MGLFLAPDADFETIDTKMNTILDTLWATKKEFLLKVPSIDEVLLQAETCEKPCCIVELGDIVSAGGTGDSTMALDALVRFKKLPPCLRDSH